MEKKMDHRQKGACGIFWAPWNSLHGENYFRRVYMEKTKISAATKWLTLISVAFAGGLITKLPYLRETYMAPLQEATGATMTQLGLLMSAYGIVNFICYFPGGILADKFSSKKLIVFSCWGTALAGFWYWTMPKFWALLVIHAIFAITTVFTFWAAMVKSINNLGGPEEQGRLFGLLEGGRGLIGTLVALGSVWAFGLASDEIGGMKNAILWYSILLLIAGAVCLFVMKDNEVTGEVEKNPLNWKDFKEVAKMPRVWLCGVLGCCNYSALIFHGYITGYMSALGVDDSKVAVLNTFRTYFMMMVGALLAGFIADKVGSRIKFINWAFLGMAIFATLYCIIPRDAKSTVTLICANFIVFGLFLYSIKALYFSTIDEVLVPKKLAGTASGIISLLTYAAEIFLYTVSGNMVDKYADTDVWYKGYINCFIWMVILSVIGFIVAIILRKMNAEAIKRGQAAGVVDAEGNLIENDEPEADDFEVVDEEVIE